MENENDDLNEMANAAAKLLSGDPQFETERKLATWAFASLILLVVASWVLLGLFFKGQYDLSAKHGFFIMLDAFACIALVSAIYHFKLFKERWTCMSGMMIGMTIGMGSGFLFGALVGATNGMFIGSIVGMAIGIFVGAWTGKCCGIMGIMEGMMAGLMAGTMGAMLSVMMLNDHLYEFLAILWLISIGILSALSFMMYKEVGNLKKEHFNVSFFEFFMACLILFLAIMAIMLFGPKTGVV